MWRRGWIHKEFKVGEANNRGPKAARVAAAMQRAPDNPPPRLVCNSCQQLLDRVEPIDVTGLTGIQQAFCGHCEPCDRDTWAVRGEAASVKAFYATLEKASGQAVQLGATSSRKLS